MKNIIKTKSKDNLTFIDTVVLSFYYLFVCFLSLGLFGLFNRLFVFIILLVLGLGLFFLRKSITFRKKDLWFFLLTAVSAVGFALLRGFFTGDAILVWLAAAKKTVETGFIPSFLTWYPYPGMPLPSLLFAATFSLFKQCNELLAVWVPIFFTGATLVLLYHWAKEKNIGKKFLFFLPFLFLTSILVQFYGSWNLLQESLVLFFTTAFFYYYEKYLTKKKKKYLILFIVSLVLAFVSKISGFFLALLLVPFFFKIKKKKIFLSYLFVFSVPVILWLVRNYLLFDNPFFPAFNSIFKGRYYDSILKYFAYAVYPDNLLTIQGKITHILKMLFTAFPYLLLSFYGFLKQKHYEYLFLFISFFLVKETFLFTATDSTARYYYLFLGLILIYSLKGLEKLKSKKAIGFFVLLAFWGLLRTPVTDSTSIFISSFEDKLSFFGQIFGLFYQYWYFVLLGLIPLVYFAVKKTGIKIFLIFLYCLFILHLRFVANKSWLNTWSFISLALLLFIIFAFKKRFKYFKQIIVVLILLALFVNSWLMSLVYYSKHGGIVFPVPSIWSESRWVQEVLDKKTHPEERDEFYILVAR